MYLRRNKINNVSADNDEDVLALLVVVKNYSHCYAYWTMHHCDSWRIRDQLDVTLYLVLFYFFYAQHISDINTSIITSLRLFHFITTLVVCWSFGVAGWGGIHVAGFSLPHEYHPNQPHRNSNTHRNKNTQPMWWYNRKVAGSWWWMY